VKLITSSDGVELVPSRRNEIEPMTGASDTRLASKDEEVWNFYQVLVDYLRVSALAIKQSLCFYLPHGEWLIF